jgi:hypothetical protein
MDFQCGGGGTEMKEVSVSIVDGLSDVRVVNGAIVILTDMGKVRAALEINPAFLDELEGIILGMLEYVPDINPEIEPVKE